MTIQESTCWDAEHRFTEAANKSVRLVDCGSDYEGLKAAYRRKRPGPESELVNWFLEELPFALPPKTHATVFREPRLDSGFPDIVVVISYDDRMAEWKSARESIKTSDLRIMHFLHEAGATREDDLIDAFGRTTSSCLHRLTDAGMVHRSGTNWHAKALAKSFAIRNIIAIEAKMTEWSSVLQQAFMNRWFASNSCILLPKLPSSKTMLEARDLEIDVLARESGPFDWTYLQPSPKPLSYASWLFNEWVWRFASLSTAD